MIAIRSRHLSCVFSFSDLSDSYNDSHLIVADPADSNSAAPASAARLLGLSSVEKVIALIALFPRRATSSVDDVERKEKIKAKAKAPLFSKKTYSSNSDISKKNLPVSRPSPPTYNASRCPHAGRGEGLPRPARAAAQEGSSGPSAEDGQDAAFGDRRRSSPARRRPDRRRTRRAGQCEHRENHRHGTPR